MATLRNKNVNGGLQMTSLFRDLRVRLACDLTFLFSI